MSCIDPFDCLYFIHIYTQEIANENSVLINRLLNFVYSSQFGHVRVYTKFE